MEITNQGQKIYSQVNQASNILLIAHAEPDADALGSIAAVSQWLDSLDKKYTQFCVTPAPANLSWILNFQALTTDPDYIASQPYDLVIVLDCGDLKYAGVDQLLPQLSAKPLIINIDHHATNQFFGDINLVLPMAVSTTEIIYQLFKNLKIKISQPMASALLAGIIYDTYNFTNPNTTYQTLEIASGLLLAGASLPLISDSILKTKTVESLKVWGEILMRLNYNKELGIASTVITSGDVSAKITEAEAAEGIANFLNNLAGIKAVLILYQQNDGIIKGSFRTNDDLIDVSKLAKMLGGGGHRKAAGFKVKGQLVRAEDGAWRVE